MRGLEEFVRCVAQPSSAPTAAEGSSMGTSLPCQTLDGSWWAGQDQLVGWIWPEVSILATPVLIYFALYVSRVTTLPLSACVYQM